MAWAKVREGVGEESGREREWVATTYKVYDTYRLISFNYREHCVGLSKHCQSTHKSNVCGRWPLAEANRATCESPLATTTKSFHIWCQPNSKLANWFRYSQRQLLKIGLADGKVEWKIAGILIDFDDSHTHMMPHRDTRYTIQDTSYKWNRGKSMAAKRQKQQRVKIERIL